MTIILELPRIFEIDRLNHFLPFNTQLALFSSASVRRCQHLYMHTAKLNYLVCLIHSTQCLICLFFVQKEIAAYWEILLRNGHVLFFQKNNLNKEQFKNLHRRRQQTTSTRTRRKDRTKISLSLTRH